MGEKEPTFGETQILELLDKNNGNIELVSKEMGMSTRYVQKVKSLFWAKPDPAVTAIISPPPATATIFPTKASDVMPYIAPDIERVTALRTEVLNLLTEKIKDRTLGGKEATKLLEVLLMYENSMRASMAPNLSIYNDHRQQTVHVTALVDELQARLTIDQLRLASGVPAPLPIEFVEGTVVPAGEEKNVTDDSIPDLDRSGCADSAE